MYILAIDIGGKTRNGICLMNKESKDIVRYTFVSYDGKKTPLDHRRKVIKEIEDIISGKESNISAIVFEKVNLYRGGNISHLTNITSLCKIQTHIIDRFSDVAPIYEVLVRSWKSKILGSAKATKEDAIARVQILYPHIDLQVPVFKKGQPDAFEYNHDLADSIMIARAVVEFPELLKNKVNYL